MQGSISDFAESLILQELSDIKSGKVAPPTNVGISTPDLGQGDISTLDISRIQVPDTLIESLTGVKSKKPQEVKAKPKAKIIKEEAKPSTEEAIVRLLLDISKKLNTLCEMTTTGAIGVNTCDTPAIKPKKKKKKKTKSELVRESLRNILNKK